MQIPSLPTWALLSLVLFVSACGGSLDTPTAGSVVADPTELPDAGVMAASPVTDEVVTSEGEGRPVAEGVGQYRLRRVEAENAGAFWASAMSVAAGTEVERYDDLEEMATSADAVIVGRMTGEVVTGPTIRDDSEPIDAEFTLVAYEVDVLELVRGSLAVGGATILLSTGSPDRSSFEPALMFLRWRGTGYEEGWAPASTEEREAWARSGHRLVSSQGLFLDTARGTWNPITRATRGYAVTDQPAFADPVGVEVSALSFDELLSLIRSYR